MKLSIQPMNRQDAEDITSWEFKPPYAIYNLTEVDIQVLIEPRNRYFIIKDDEVQIIGYCCFGGEARVPGGEYTDFEPNVIDVGIGMHPRLVGMGKGKVFVETILWFALAEFSPKRFRVTIAKFNERSQKTFLKLGFVEIQTFTRKSDGMRFIRLERGAF